MAERLVDVLDRSGAVLHTYPITLGELGDVVDDGAYEEKALETAAHGRLVPDNELRSSTARIHVSRGGQMSSYGDDVQGDSETKVGLEHAVRERAYALWEQDGCPESRAEEYRYRALDENLRERAYALWQQYGSPAGRADEYWQRLVNFRRDKPFLGRHMHLHYKGFRIVPVSRTVFNGFIASAVVRARHGSRHVGMYSTEHSSGELARFDTADEAFGCAVVWGFSWVDHKQ